MSDVALRTDLSRRAAAKAAMELRSNPSSNGVASVSVHTDPRAVLAEWQDLAERSPATPYQRPAWILPWIDTVGASLGITPMIVLARDADGRGVALLPLGLQRQGVLTLSSFLGAKDSNFNMGLFRPGTTWTREALHALLRRAGAESRDRIDLFAFRNQPHDWQGAANPLLALARQPSPSFAYKATLCPDPDLFLKAHLSRETRKKLRQKRTRLGDLGTVTVVEVRTAAESAEVLDAFMVQRMARNVASGLCSHDLPALRRFLDRTVGGDGPIAFYGLRCGDRIVATLGGVRCGDRFSGMLTSFTAEAEFARTSPGELILAEVMRRHCAAGFATFDLGIGEARYKETYCPEVEELFDSLVPLTPRGHLFARAEGLRLQLKRGIKQSRWAWPMVQRLRRASASLAGGRIAAARSGDGPGEAARLQD